MRPESAPKKESIRFSLRIYWAVSCGVKPSTFTVATSRMRSMMLMLVKLYKVINASAPEQKTSISTSRSMLAMEFSRVSRSVWVRLT